MGLKLMCVVAHPDDECFGFGGALALAAGHGVETYVLCLTDGQAATSRGTAATGVELGQMRREEFAASCEVLGVRRHEQLDFQDGRLEFTDFSATAGRLVERMRQFQPDVVLTFGGEGGLNTHADHMMTSMLTTAAFHWAGRPQRYPELGEPFQPRRLFYLTSHFLLADRQAPLLAPWMVRLDIASVLPQKQEAFRRHVSQAPLIERTRAVFEQFGREECYTLAASPEIQPARVSADLFEGLE